MKTVISLRKRCKKCYVLRRNARNVIDCIIKKHKQLQY